MEPVVASRPAAVGGLRVVAARPAQPAAVTCGM
jgi:hypothetical protein